MFKKSTPTPTATPVFDRQTAINKIGEGACYAAGATLMTAFLNAAFTMLRKGKQ